MQHGNQRRNLTRILICGVSIGWHLAAATSGWAGSIWVSPTGSDANSGDMAAPLASIQTALNLAMPGDEIVLRDGTYQEPLLQTVRNGTSGARIVLRAENAGAAMVTAVAGQGIFELNHANHTVQGVVFDGGFTPADLLRVRVGADHLRVQNVEVRNGARDGIDLGDNETSGGAIGAGFDFLEGVEISDSSFHHLLWNENGVRMDAHGIVAGGVRDFTIRNTQSFLVSGDALQLQNGAWDNVLVDSVDFYNAPLDADTAGFLAGQNPGENGIDTKQDPSIATRGTLTVLNSLFHGWNTTLIGNPAALNLKEKVEVFLDGNTVYDNDIGLRLRGAEDEAGALVTSINGVLHDNRAGVRYEDEINNLTLLNNTFGATHALFLEDGGGGGLGAGFEALNNLFEAGAVPGEASDPSNLSVSADSFVNSPANDFHLTAGSPAIDSGLTLSEVPTDFDGVLRPQGFGYDVGAFEFLDSEGPVAPGVPEPATQGLLLLGLAAILLAAGRRRLLQGRN